MRLGELAFASYVYGRMNDYDGSYKRLLDATRPEIDLKSHQHLLTLLKWLNDWGCRQFAKEDHDLAAEEIEEWYSKYSQRFISKDITILSLTDKNVKSVECAFADLVVRTASYRKLSSGCKSRVQVGPTGTAKILFALRPAALLPWDDRIREELGLDGSAHSYSAYLRIAKDHLKVLSHDCRHNGFKLTDLPHKLGRPDSSIAKLIDEYFWVTISRKCPAPSTDELKCWVSWS